MRAGAPPPTGRFYLTLTNLRTCRPHLVMLLVAPKNITSRSDMPEVRLTRGCVRHLARSGTVRPSSCFARDVPPEHVSSCCFNINAVGL